MSLGAPADKPEFTYHTNVSEIRLTFSATDQNNHGVATLQARDFAIVDKDLVVRNFQSFGRTDWTKLDITILVDTSESAGPHFRQEIAGVVEMLSGTAGVPEENVSLISFHDLQPTVICAGNCRAPHALDQLVTAKSAGLTPLFDTVVFASEILSRRDEKYGKALIVFSDGEDTVSRSSLADAIAAAQNVEVQVYPLDMSNSATHGSAMLANLAASTGGRYFRAPDDVLQSLNLILEGFRASYTVSYRLPSHASGFHTVQILPTHNRNLQFRTRSGYYYPSSVR